MLHLSFMKYDDTIGTTVIGHEINTRVFESSLLNNFYNNAVLNIMHNYCAPSLTRKEFYKLQAIIV